MNKQLQKQIKSLLLTFVFLAFSFTTFAQATPDLVVYDDALKNSFEDYSWRGKNNNTSVFNFSNSANVLNGTKSISANINEAYNYMSFFRPNNVMKTSDYPGGITFWVYGTKTVGTNTNVRLYATVLGGTEYTVAGVKSKSPTVSAAFNKNFEVPVGKWTKVNVAWSELGNPTTFDHIGIGSNSDQIGQEYFIDDVIVTSKIIPKSAYLYDDAFGLGHTLTGYPSAPSGVAMTQSTSSIRREITNPNNPWEPIKIGSKALYCQHGPNYSAMVLIKYSDKTELTSDYPGGIGFWVWGAGPTGNKGGTEITVSTYGYAGPPSYGWNERSNGQMTVVVPLFQWTYVHTSWAALGNPSRVGGLTLALSADVSTNIGGVWYGAGNSAFIVDDIKLLKQTPCTYPNYTLQGNVSIFGKQASFNNMFVTVLQNDEIVNIAPVINGNFKLDRKLCDGFYDVLLTNEKGGSLVPAAPKGYSFRQVTGSGGTTTNNGKITLGLFGQNTASVNFDLMAVTPSAKNIASEINEISTFDIENPAVNGSIKVKTNTNNPQFNLFTSLGRKIDLKVNNIGNGGYLITPNQKLDGVYYLNLYNGEMSKSKKVVFVK